MKRLLFTMILFTLITGCATIPGPVAEQYLADKTEKDSERLEQIETEIIAKNREKLAAEQNRRENTPDIERTEEELDLLLRENKLLKDQLELYTKSKDARNIEIKRDELAKNNVNVAKHRNLLKYQEAQKNLFDAEAELKNAELAVLVAQLNYEKAEIAKEYREKNEPAVEPEKKGLKGFFSSFFKEDPEDRFDYKKYSVHLEKMKKEQEKAIKKYNEAKAAYDAAKKNLNTPSGEVE
jgi:hypothetical protein